MRSSRPPSVLRRLPGGVLRPAALTAALALLAVLPAAAAELAARPAGPPPGDLPQATAGSLVEEGASVEAGGEPVLSVWLRSPLPAEEGGGGGLGVAFGGLVPGALVGVVRLEREWRDYKEQPVPAGTYAARYLVAPADGAHTGVSLYRDFLLLIPVAEDPGPEAVLSSEETVAASRQATGTIHPAVMALFPVYPGEGEELPRVVENDAGQPTLGLPASDAGPGAAGGRALGLVVEGHGEV